MSTDNDIREIQNDIRAIKSQLEALVCESRLKRLDTLSFLLELAYKEASDAPGAASEEPTVNNLPLTLQ